MDFKSKILKRLPKFIVGTGQLTAISMAFVLLSPSLAFAKNKEYECGLPKHKPVCAEYEQYAPGEKVRALYRYSEAEETYTAILTGAHMSPGPMTVVSDVSEQVIYKTDDEGMYPYSVYVDKSQNLLLLTNTGVVVVIDAQTFEILTSLSTYADATAAWSNFHPLDEGEKILFRVKEDIFAIVEPGQLSHIYNVLRLENPEYFSLYDFYKTVITSANDRFLALINNNYAVVWDTSVTSSLPIIEHHWTGPKEVSSVGDDGSLIFNNGDTVPPFRRVYEPLSGVLWQTYAYMSLAYPYADLAKEGDNQISITASRKVKSSEGVEPLAFTQYKNSHFLSITVPYNAEYLPKRIVEYNQALEVLVLEEYTEDDRERRLVFNSGIREEAYNDIDQILMSLDFYELSCGARLLEIQHGAGAYGSIITLYLLDNLISKVLSEYSYGDHSKSSSFESGVYKVYRTEQTVDNKYYYKTVEIDFTQLCERGPYDDADWDE